MRVRHIQYTDDNISATNMQTLVRLGSLTLGDDFNGENFMDSVYEGHFVSQLSQSYGLNPETARIILHPNFAIIYDVDIINSLSSRFNGFKARMLNPLTWNKKGDEKRGSRPQDHT